MRTIEKKSDIDCPLCGSARYRVWLEPRQVVEDPEALYGAASGIQGTQRLVICSDCTLLYENPRFSAETILRGYASSIESGHDSQRSMRVGSFLGALRSLSRDLPLPGASVLDIGCAGGAFLEAARHFGYDAVGLEPSRFLVEQGRARGLNLHQGTIDQHALPEGAFDMVCLWDVIEHLADPGEALRRIRPLLKPGGVLLVNYPDIGTWQARLAGKRFWWLLSVHLSHFTQHTMREICIRNGYDVFSFRSYWQTLEFGYLQGMAAHLGIPGAKLFQRLTPAAIRQIPLPYYASQTTALARPVDA
jgi:2-polyprenyl-3-methyl-5-hydroxy-6-metoxy-1,4-benzoquinol methylase